MYDTIEQLEAGIAAYRQKKRRRLNRPVDRSGGGGDFDGDHNLAHDVPQEALDLWQDKPDFHNDPDWELRDASNYDGRSGDLSNLIEDAAADGALVDLGSGTYEMESTVTAGGTVGVVGDGARVYYVGTDLEYLFSTSPEVFVLEGVTFDITEDPDVGTTDIGLANTWGISQEGWFQDVTLEGARQRWQYLVDDDPDWDDLESVGGLYTFLIQADAGATCFMHRCEFPDGGTDMSEEREEMFEKDPDDDRDEDQRIADSNSGHAIGPNADPAHEGLNVWKECVSKKFYGNGFYVHGGTGENILWDCVAENNGKGNIRVSWNDRVIGGRVVVDDSHPDLGNHGGGTPFVSNAGDNIDVLGLEMVGEGGSWGGEAIQIRRDSEEVHFRDCVLHVKSGGSRPIRCGTDEDVDVTFEDCYLLDEGDNDGTAYISHVFGNPADLYLAGENMVSGGGTEYYIGSNGTLHHGGTEYSDEVVSADDLGQPTLTEDDFPEFYFDYSEVL